MTYKTGLGNVAGFLSGYAATVTDGDGEKMTFSYGYNEATKEYNNTVTFPNGKIKEVWFNSDGEKIRTDINGVTVEEVQIDRRNRIITDWNGNKTQKYFNEWDKLTKIVYPNGYAVSYEYESKYSQVNRKVDERGIITPIIMMIRVIWSV